MQTNDHLIHFISFSPEGDARQLRELLATAREAAGALAEAADGDRSIARAWRDVAGQLEALGERAGWVDRISRGA